MNTKQLKRALATLLPPESISEVETTAALTAALGDCVPTLSVRPTRRSEAAAILAWAADQDLAVVPRGSGTKLAIGNRPRRGDLFLETSSLEPILEPMPQDLVARVSAGTTLAELERALLPHRLRLAVDPPDADRATLGGLVATNSFGPMRTRAGTLRDHVLGLSVISPSGIESRSGGSVVKNVSGYDVMKLHVGGLGALGLITEMFLRLSPLPETSLTTVQPYASSRVAWEDAQAIRIDGKIEPEVMEIFSSRDLAELAGIGGHCGLTLRFEGAPLSVRARATAAHAKCLHSEQSAAELDGERGRELSLALARALAQGRSVADPSGELLLVRLAVRPSRLGDLLDACERLVEGSAGSVTLLSTPACGLVDLLARPASILTEQDPELKHLREIVAGLRGRTYLLASPLELRETIDAMGGRTGAFALMQALKQTLDPRGTFNPGRHVGGL
ncbi:MAG: FAD-binding oxidoreductase [Planctomycetota bacterium]